MRSYSTGRLWNEYDSRYQTVMYVAVVPSSWIFLGSAIIMQLEKMSLKRYSFVCSLELLDSQDDLLVCSCSRVCHLSIHCLSTIFTEASSNLLGETFNYLPTGNFLHAFCPLLNFFKIIFKKLSFRNTTRVSNNLIPDQA